MNNKKEQVSQKISYIQAEYLMKYGMEMDEWSAINFAEIKEHFNAMRLDLNASRLESKRLHETFKGSIKPINFSSGKQSFVYGLGASIPYAVCALILGVLCYYYLITLTHFREVSAYAADLKNIESYRDLIRHGNIRAENGTEFLILKLAKEKKNPFGQVYEFDAKRQEVRVPLRRLK